ncbi:MAG: leucine-rich repeat protein, partial [Eubacterium sp.]|nr:leucine-rich repeat protein [Eubacterium sp.]
IFAATMEGENQYRFALEDQPVNTGDSAFPKKYGVITIQENKARLQMAHSQDREIIYDKELTRREPLEEKKNISLTSYMDKKTDVPGDCSVGKDSKGEIKMIQNSLEENEYNYNLGGINRYCFEADCENLWGNATETISLDNGTKKAIYKENGFIYTITFDSFGLVCELLCMKDSDAYRQEGDFLLDGDTVVKYLGYNGKSKEIKLPKQAKKIASGAFTQSNTVYKSLKAESSSVYIPAEIEVERDAFRHCGKMRIILMGNWKVIPEGAFAHLVPNDLKDKRTWVHVSLPFSPVTIQKDAFNQDEGTVNWPRYIREIDSNSKSPVVVENWDSVKEVAEDSLRGITIEDDGMYRNKSLTSLTGGGILSRYGEDLYDDTIMFFVPEQVKTLEKGAIQMMENDKETFPNYLMLPEGLDKIQEEAIVPMYRIPTVKADEKSKYFMNNELDWLYSKDGDDLYTVVFGGDSYYDMIEDGANTIARIGPVDKKYRKWFRGDAIQVPSGVKNIHSYALSGLCVTESWKEIRIPSSVKKISRNALYSENYS